MLGAVFIFSGFVKADDPYGMVYKIEEYLLYFTDNGEKFSFLPLFMACLMAVYEFTLGAWLVFGIRKRITSILIFLTMAVLTPFTLFVALKNPVTDCGCFGDAIHLTNWETFGKNVVLLFMAIWLLKHYSLMIKFISNKSQWIISLYSILYSAGIVYYCINYLPIFDFRPYHVGANISQQMSVPEGKKLPVYDTMYLMEKNGVKKEFTSENFPDSTWTYVDSHTYIKEEGYEPPITDFSLSKTDTGEDVTQKILDTPGYTFLLISPYLDTADDSSIDLINEIYDYSVENKYPFYCVTSSETPQREEWKDRTGAEYPYLTADATVLRTMIRSNPGLILLKQGTIIRKWSNQDLPDEYALSKRLEKIPAGQIQEMAFRHRVAGVVLWFVMPLLLLTLLDNLYRMVKYRKLKKQAKKE